MSFAIMLEPLPRRLRPLRLNFMEASKNKHLAFAFRRLPLTPQTASYRVEKIYYLSLLAIILFDFLAALPR
jgi:hypothetical protein